MKKLSLAICVLLLSGMGIYFYSTKHESKLKTDVIGGNHHQVKIHFLTKSINPKVDFDNKIKMSYELYLVDNQRPMQKGKLIERRAHLTEKDSLNFQSGTLLPGIEKAMLQMSKDSEAWVYIPWQLAFGEKGAGDGLVPPKQDLVAVIRIMK